MRKEDAGEYGMLISAHQLIDNLRPLGEGGCQAIVISCPAGNPGSLRTFLAIGRVAPVGANARNLQRNSEEAS
jgi:Asp/Glu/hydantoin racemase